MENGKMIFGSANCKLADVPSGIANAAQPHALNFTPSGGRNMFTKQIGKTVRGDVKIDLGECLGIYVLRVYADDKQVHKEKLICL